MTIKSGPIDLVYARASDPSQFGRLVRWDTDFRQLSSGSGLTQVSGRSGRHLSAAGVSIQGKVHQIGAGPKGLVSFGMPARSKLVSWMGYDMPSQPLVSFGSGREFDGVSAEGFSAVVLSIDEARFYQAASDLRLELPARLANGGLFALESKPGLAARISKSASAFLGQGLCGDQAELEDELTLALVLSVSQARLSGTQLTGVSRAKVRARALEFIESRLDRPLKIQELCRYCDVSWPTLHRSFKDRFGVGPKAYLTSLRLHRVRAELKNAPDGTKVGRIANDWGFWHMGEFAKAYRDLFKCLPSDDLGKPKVDLRSGIRERISDGAQPGFIRS